MTGEEKRETRIIRCPACRRYYRIAGPPAPGTRLRCSKCGEIFSMAAAAKAPGPTLATPVPAPAGVEQSRVLVATDGQEFQILIGKVLGAAGFSLRQACSGDEAWEAIGSWRPHVALLDVGLPGVPAFEVCDRVRADMALRGIGLILIASVFQQTRYKRAPTSLYGADDYIEKHHIRDWLPGKVVRLLSVDSAPAAPEAAAPALSGAGKYPGRIDEREQETLIREELYGSQGRERKGLERVREQLRRYARIIVSDIALYNQKTVEQGIREGTFSELLKREIDEGYRLYLLRVPPSTGGEDYYHEAVRDFIAMRTGALGAGASRPQGNK